MSELNETTQTVETANKVKVIKKYANRKFYDTETSKYITLSQIKTETLTREILVVENTSKKDITRQTLASALLESVEEVNALSLDIILDLIKKSQNKGQVE